jgi:hypothetical protein
VRAQAHARRTRGEGGGFARPLGKRSLIRTVPIFSRSLTRRVCSFRSRMSSIAMLTKTSLVLIRSTTMPKRSSVPNIPAKKPCETFLRFDCTFSTTIRSLIVTAVGSRCRCRGDTMPVPLTCAFVSIPSTNAAPKSGSGLASESASGSMTVPPPRGFSTFLMRIGIFRRIT